MVMVFLGAFLFAPLEPVCAMFVAFVPVFPLFAFTVTAVMLFLAFRETPVFRHLRAARQHRVVGLDHPLRIRRAR